LRCARGEQLRFNLMLGNARMIDAACCYLAPVTPHLRLEEIGEKN
jgi:hypothetical protein